MAVGTFRLQAACTRFSSIAPATALHRFPLASSLYSHGLHLGASVSCNAVQQQVQSTTEKQQKQETSQFQKGQKKVQQESVTPRSQDFNMWYLDVIAAAELADYGPVRGTMVIRPYGYAIWEAIQNYLDAKFKETEHYNMYFPQFIPYSFIEKEASHVEGFSPELALVTIGGGKELEEKLVVRPTSETIVNHMFTQWIHSYMNELLCLNAANHIPKLEGRLPHPSECRLYYVNRDTLFSFHKASEVFLQRMMALYVASHYKNTPNDLQLMSDAPAHHLFVLLGPVDESQNTMPDILCVVQVCLEGKISRESALRSLSAGTSPSGDQIPWKVSEQFQDTEFPSLSGARIVRIAVHPSLVRAGYGSVTVDLLARYYEGQLTELSEVEDEPVIRVEKEKIVEAAEKVSLLEEVVKPRSNLPPLLVGLNERMPEKIHYLGVSFGLTMPLYNFWHKHDFWPLYIGQIPNSITGEHSCIVLRALESDEVDLSSNGQMKWVRPFNYDFRRRFINLLGSCFRTFAPALALSVVDPKINFSDQEAHEGSSLEEVFEGAAPMLTPYDMKRLESYSNNLVDYHLILDLVPILARYYFLERLPATLSYGQAAILLCLGLQHQSVSFVEGQLNLPRNQVLALFNKSIRKLYNQLNKAASKKVEAALPRLKEVNMTEHMITVEEDLDDGARQVKADMKRKLEEMLKPEALQKYAISADADLELSKVGKVPKSGFVSVKSMSNGHATKDEESAPDEKALKKKMKKEHRKSHSKKSRN